MSYLIFCRDNENSFELRKKNRNYHLKYLERFRDKILSAGPILNDSDKPIGSCIIIDLKNKKELDDFTKNDPYYKVGLFKNIEKLNFKKVF